MYGGGNSFDFSTTFKCLYFLELTKTPLFVDEVGAIVFDVGAQSVRAGYAGEDCPKVHVISFILFPFLPLLVIRYLVRRHLKVFFGHVLNLGVILIKVLTLMDHGNYFRIINCREFQRHCVCKVCWYNEMIMIVS